VDGKTLAIHAERRRQDSGPCRSEFRYGSLTRLVRLPARVDATDVTARYEKGVLEVSVPVREARPEGSRVTIEHQAAPGHQHPRGGGNQRTGTGTPPGQPGP
jgi:HSP20 family molecular chaperone IbpA